MILPLVKHFTVLLHQLLQTVLKVHDWMFWQKNPWSQEAAGPNDIIKPISPNSRAYKEAAGATKRRLRLVHHPFENTEN